MRASLLVQMIVAIGFVCGCTTHPPETARGNYDSTYMEGHPAPAASPSMRPGLNPDDPRNPQFNSRPDPRESPPTSKP